MTDDPKLIGLVNKNSEDHIIFIHHEHAFCNEYIKSDSVKVLPDYIDPMSFADNICEECQSEYESWLNGIGERAPTVECQCDGLTKNGIETCESVVSAYDARELNHPASEGGVPVCPNCYRWIRSVDQNNVTTKYENAEPWLRKSKPPEIETQSNE